MFVAPLWDAHIKPQLLSEAALRHRGVPVGRRTAKCCQEDQRRCHGEAPVCCMSGVASTLDGNAEKELIQRACRVVPGVH
eukprot:40803-Eustigmatos_ZCMA.PRE.1